MPSPMATTWSAHSRQIDPISLYATPFCRGEPAAMGEELAENPVRAVAAARRVKNSAGRSRLDSAIALRLSRTVVTTRNGEVVVTLAEGSGRIADASRDAKFGQGGADQRAELIVDFFDRRSEIGISGYHRDLHGARADRKGSATRSAHQHRPTHLWQSCCCRLKTGPAGLAARNDQGSLGSPDEDPAPKFVVW